MNRIALGLAGILIVLAACSGRTGPEPQAVTVAGMANAERVGDLLFGAQPSREVLAQAGKAGMRGIRPVVEHGWSGGMRSDLVAGRPAGG